MIYKGIFYARIVNIWNNLPNFVVNTTKLMHLSLGYIGFEQARCLLRVLQTMAWQWSSDAS